MAELLSGADGAQAESEAALVAGCGIFLDDAPFGRAINERKGGGNCFGGTFGVLLIEQTAHGADLVAELSFAETVDSGAAFCDADALQRRDCICHLPDLYLNV